MTEEEVAQIEAAGGAQYFEIWPENWEAFSAFLFVATQWRTESIGGGMEPGRIYWQGLDYGAVAAAWSGGGISSTPELWADLRVMEAAARNALNGVTDGDDEWR